MTIAQENAPSSIAESEPPTKSAPPAEKKYSREARRKRRRNLIIPIVALVLIVAGLPLWWYLSRYESTDDAQADVHLYPPSARISGYVVRVNVNDNQWVNKGDVLAEIDPTDYQVALAQVQANLANAESMARSLNITVPITSVNTVSQLQFTASGIQDARADQKQLAAVHEQVEVAEANDVKAQDDLHRYKLLFDKREVAPQIYDRAFASAKSRTANVTATKANESAAQQFVQQAQSRLAQAAANHAYAQTGPQQVSSTRARVRAAIADVEEKRALVEKAKLNLEYTNIVAASPVSTWLARFLVCCCRNRHADEGAVRAKLNHETIAQHIGCSRETVSRMLSDFAMICPDVSREAIIPGMFPRRAGKR